MEDSYNKRDTFALLVTKQAFDLIRSCVSSSIRTMEDFRVGDERIDELDYINRSLTDAEIKDHNSRRSDPVIVHAGEQLWKVMYVNSDGLAQEYPDKSLSAFTSFKSARDVAQAISVVAKSRIIVADDGYDFVATYLHGEDVTHGK